MEIMQIARQQKSLCCNLHGFSPSKCMQFAFFSDLEYGLIEAADFSRCFVQAPSPQTCRIQFEPGHTVKSLQMAA
jgi:hypothetical protein